MDKKSQIVQLAAKIIAEEGISKLTLSRIAEAASLTKAGLLHHFPNMDTLKEAVLRWCDERYTRAYTQAIDTVPPYPGRTPEIYLKTMAETYAQDGGIADAAGAALYAAASEKSFVTQAYENSYERIKADCRADGGDYGEALSIIMAFEAMCFGTFSTQLTDTERDTIYQSLVKRAEQLKERVA